MITRRRLALATVAAFVLVACGGGDSAEDASTTSSTLALDSSIALNQVQAIGTHNSFHIAPDPAERALMDALSPAAGAERSYTHRPLGEQLADQRVRQLELDVFADPGGGLFAEPFFREQAGLGPYDAPGMDAPGTKVLHEQDVDYRSVCVTLASCLDAIREWSDANPGHAPVAVHIQLKDGRLVFNVPQQAVPVPWEASRLDNLDTEIRDRIGLDRMITPDDVRGSQDTLEAAVLSDGWPTLAESRGKFLFFMINAEPYRSIYREGRPNLEGRVMFTNSEPGEPDAAYVGVDDPVADGGRIRELVAEGYLVRTRADTPNVEAGAGDTTRLEAALASGAHWVSTDYPGPDGARPTLGTDYVAQLPGFLPVRCNPVTAPATCDDARLEPPPG